MSRPSKDPLGIRASMARALFVDSWANREQERGRSHGGRDLMFVAPRTSSAAKAAANKLAHQIETLTGRSMESLYHAAESDPGHHSRQPTPHDFGHYIAMQALGHGVSWADDHPDLPFDVPHAEFYL